MYLIFFCIIHVPEQSFYFEVLYVLLWQNDDQSDSPNRHPAYPVSVIPVCLNTSTQVEKS